MRIGNSQSASYRRVMASRRKAKIERIARLCERLDKLVEHAEKFGRHTLTRRTFMERADKVREKLRAVDH